MQCAVGHENQVFGVEALAQRSEQLVVERSQVGQCGIQQWFLEALRISGANAKLRKLKPQKVQKMGYSRYQAHRHYLNRFGIDQDRDQAIPRRIVFDQRRMRRQIALHSIQ